MKNSYDRLLSRFYDLCDELQRSKIRDNEKGPYIEVRQHGKYYGRCYI